MPNSVTNRNAAVAKQDSVAVSDEEVFLELFGSSDPHIANKLLKQIEMLSATPLGPDDTNVQFLLSCLEGMKPQNLLEATLILRIATAQRLVALYEDRLIRAETQQQIEVAEKAYSKLVRSLTSLVDCLQRCKTGGQQNVTVKHVTVSEGGQAIVGQVLGSAAPESIPSSQSPSSARKRRFRPEGRG